MPKKPEVDFRPIPHTRGLSLHDAAMYVGISNALFERAVASGQMPQPRVLAGRNVWDIVELNSAFDKLPHRGDHDNPAAMSERDRWLATQT